MNAIDRASHAEKIRKAIYIPTKSHREVQDRMEILRLSHQGQRGKPMTGLRLSQISSAGKSSMLENYVERTLDAHAASTGTPNPYLILVINLLTVSTIKMLCQAILNALGDQNYQRGNTDVLIHRMREFLVKADTQLIIIDECQQLIARGGGRVAVSDQLKNILNLGISPIMFVGDETSTSLFDENIQLANRTGVPLRLDPIRPQDKERLPEFKRFCVKLEEELITRGAMERKGALSQASGIKLLLTWSAGHLGRVSRIVEQALQHCALRNAATIEMADLNYAIQNFAMPNGYIHHGV